MNNQMSSLISKNKRATVLVSLLFAVYLALLVWIILFKLQFSLRELDTVRSVNWIPFYYDKEVGGIQLHSSEMIQNLLIFAPLGIYLCMFPAEPKGTTKLLLALGISAALEIAQYVLAIGRSDITDLLMNTCGSMLGVGIYYAITKIVPNRTYVNRFFAVVAALVTIVVIGGLAFLLAAN